MSSPSPAFPRRVVAAQVYCAAKRSAAHEPNVLFFAFSASAWAESQRVACLYISATGLPLNTILGNSRLWRHEKGPKLLRPCPVVSLRALLTLAVPLRCLFDRFSRPLPVLRC